MAVAVLLFGFSLSGLSFAEAAAQDESVKNLMSKGEKVAGFSYDYVMEQTIDGNKVKMTGKVFSSGQKTRNESAIDGQKMIVITDGEAKVMYNYNPGQNSAMKISFDGNKGANTPAKFDGKTDAAKVKILGTDTYDGIKCKILSIEGERGEATKMWVREDYGLPVKIETVMPNGKMTMEHKNMKIGPQPAELFKLPSGVEITDMSEMMKNIPPRP